MTDVEYVTPDEWAADQAVIGDDRALVPEVVARESDRDIAAQAISAAARQALQEPGSADRDEFLNLALQARMLSMSELAPKALRGKPYNALVVIATARALGLDPWTSMNVIHVIDGKPTLAVQLQVALLRRRGLGSITPHPDNREDVAWAVVRDASGNELGPPVPFSWEDGQRAQLVTSACEPNGHSEACIKNRRNPQARSCKDNWANYPADMLYWRAAARAIRFYFPEVALGVYSPDEVGALTDSAGEPIDPATVELPAGFDDPDAERRERQAAAEAPADGGDLWHLQARIAALPEASRASLRERWSQKGTATCGYRPAVLPAKALNYAKSLVAGTEAGAKREGYDPDLEVPAMLNDAFRHLLAVFTGWDGMDEQPVDPDPAPESPDTAPDAPAGSEGPADTEPPAEPEFDVDGDGQGDEHPAMTDDERKEVADRLRQALADADPALVATVSSEVKEMHWREVNRQLEERGEATEGRHIETRRMLLTGLIVTERMAAAAGE